MSGNRGFRPDKPIEPEVLFALFSNPMKIKTFEALGYRMFTLDSLAKRIGKSKAATCAYVSEMRRVGIAEKIMFKERARYRARCRGLLPIIKKARKLCLELQALRATETGSGKADSPGKNQGAKPARKARKL